MIVDFTLLGKNPVLGELVKEKLFDCYTDTVQKIIICYSLY